MPAAAAQLTELVFILLYSDSQSTHPCGAGHWDNQNNLALIQKDTKTTSFHSNIACWGVSRYYRLVSLSHVTICDSSCHDQVSAQPFLITFVVVAAGGFIRVYITDGSFVNSCAISLSLFLIVMTSVLTGTMLPFGLAKLGVDPANAGTSVQVCLLPMLTCLSSRLY